MLDQDGFKKRKAELEKTLELLNGFVDRRNTLLVEAECEFMRKLSLNKFTLLLANNPRAGTKMIMTSFMKIANELGLKLIRKNVFYLQKRRRFLLCEIEKLNEEIKK